MKPPRPPHSAPALFRAILFGLGLGFATTPGSTAEAPLPPLPTPNLVRNSSFEEIGDGVASAAAWSLSGPARAALDTAERRSGRSSLKVTLDGARPATPEGKPEAPPNPLNELIGPPEVHKANVERAPASGRPIVRPGGAAILSQSIPAEPGTDYYVSVWVKSNDRVVLKAGKSSFSYTSQGEWQKLCGLVRTAAEKELTPQVLLGGLPGGGGVMWVDDVVVHKATFPTLGPRQLHGATEIVRDGKPSAWIVVPTSVPACRDLALGVQKAILDRTGVTLPIVTDAEATRKDAPVLIEPYRSSHLILLGRLGTNRAFWSAYNRFLDATDGWYPGGDGFVVRTASNVLRNGKNHLILGGSSEKGVARAAERFAALVRGEGSKGLLEQVKNAVLPASAKRTDSLTLPWLLEAELGGACLEAFQADDKLWQEDPTNRLLPPIEAGYGTVRRWYQNAMAWYWSGWPSYWQRASEHLDLVLKDRAYTHQYPLEFFVRVYDMLDDSGRLSAEQVRNLDSLLLQNFWDFGYVDAGWMRVFSPPYEEISIVNRHQISPWMSDLVLAEFLDDYLPLQGEPKEVVNFRRTEKDRFFQHLIRNRWEVSQPSVGSGGTAEEVVHTLFRYALDNDHYEFFTLGMARNAADTVLAKLNPLNGIVMRPVESYDYHLIFGAVAHFFQDGRYKTILNKVPESVPSRQIFMGRYLNGVRRYTPGEELPEASCDGLTGVIQPSMMPHNVENLKHLSDRKFRPSTLDADRLLDLVIFRSGFSRDDDFIVFSGTREGGVPPNIFLSFTSRGVLWFGGGNSDDYFNLNAVTVQRLDLSTPPAKPFAGAARREWVSNLHRAGAMRSRLSPCMDTEWVRDIIWIRPGLYLVRDTLTALENGTYLFNIAWRPVGSVTMDGDCATFATRGARLKITPLAPGWTTACVREEDRGWRRTSTFVRQSLTRTLKSGESVTATHLLQASSETSDPFLTATLASPREVRIENPSDAASATRVVWGPFSERQIETDAAVAVVRKDQVQFTRGTRLTAKGRLLVAADRPSSVAVDWTTGECRTDPGDAAKPVKVRVAAAQGSSMTEQLADPKSLSWQLPAPRGAPPELAAALPAPSSAPSTPSVASSAKSPERELRDVSSSWRVAWRYGGLLRPAQVDTTAGIPNHPELVDLGAEVELAEISDRETSRTGEGGVLPTEISLAPAELVNGVAQMPTEGSPLWRKVTEKPVWRASVITANYGRGDPNSQGFQVIHLPPGVRARYVRAARAPFLTYHRRDVLQAREPLRVESVDFGGKDGQALFLKSDIWPSYRRLRNEDDAIAVVGLDGKERFQYEVPTNLQSARALAWESPARKHIVLTTVDAMVRLFEPGGKIAREINLYELHKEFNRAFGHPNTRHPAGGYTIPTSVGLWRREAEKPARMVVGRYVGFSFLDGEGKFEGLLGTGGYWNPVMLPYGADFDGDGKEEMLCVGAMALYHLDGDPIPVVSDPNGTKFYPEVYRQQFLVFPDGDSRPGLAGAPNLLFELLPWENKPHYALVVSENFLAIYDGRTRRWAFSLVPGAPISAAAIADSGPQHLKVLFATRDGLLRQIEWKGEVSKPTATGFVPFAPSVQRMAPVPGIPGAALLATDGGLFLARGLDKVELIQKGAFHDACVLAAAGESPSAIAAVTETGEVLRLDGRQVEPAPLPRR